VTSAPTSTTSPTTSWPKTAGAFVAGLVLSVHHYAIGALFVGGVAAFVIGKKLRGV